MPVDKTNPPKWCKHAIATERGWVDPDTNELLISTKGIKIPSSDDSEETNTDTPPKPKKRRGRPKKTSS